jgi:hypothetical protein
MLIILAAAIHILRPPVGETLPPENQPTAQDFRITVTRDNELWVGEKYATNSTGIRVEPLTENFSSIVELEYSPQIQGLEIEFFPPSDTPPFESEVTIRGFPEFPDNMLGVPIDIVITGTSQENISRSVSIEVTVMT